RADEAAGRRQHERAAAVEHRLAVPVPVWALDPVRAADANVVGRGDALAALIEADEEEELAVMLDDRGGFDHPVLHLARGDGDRGLVLVRQLAGVRIE